LTVIHTDGVLTFAESDDRLLAVGALATPGVLMWNATTVELRWPHRTSVVISATVSCVADPDRNIMPSH
jgi:hypothetical protein